MRVFPEWDQTPAESTVEQAANHALLTLLAPAVSWIYVPTRREELSLGYDASLQGLKACVIQYKRARALKRVGGISASLNPAQHNALTTWLPGFHQPWVLFGVAEFHSYRELASSASHSSGAGLCEHFLFVSAHSIPIGATTVRFQRHHPTDSPVAQAFAGRKKLGSELECVDAPTLARRLRQCSSGVMASVLTDQESRSPLEGSPGRLNVLFAEPAV